MQNVTTEFMIAPCGIDCRLCRANSREKKACLGCRAGKELLSVSCAACRILNCTRRLEGGYSFCYECGEYPCDRLRQLNKRYNSKYGTSVLENLAFIRANGLTSFVALENNRWICPNCGQMLCMHKPVCLNCGYKWNHASWWDDHK
jgi:hypothetical protein